MGGGLAGPELAVAVADAGGLGTLGLAPPAELRVRSRRSARRRPDRAVAVNLLTPFLRRSHVSLCVRAGVDVAVVAFGGDRELVDELREAGIFVFVMVGTEDQARRAVFWGADGLIAQGCDAGGHLCGTVEALNLLPRALAVAGGRPVLLAGGIATGSDTRAALAAGASGVIAGTRFLLTHESRAHPEYQRRILAADKTIRTMLVRIGLARAASGDPQRRHRAVVRCRRKRQGRSPTDQRPQRFPGQTSGDDLGAADAASESFRCSPPSPLPSECRRRRWIASACYAGQTALRMNSVTSARQAVADLAPGGQ